MTIKEVISVYSNHPSIRKIKNLCVPENKCDLLYASWSSINRIIKSLNVNKAKGPDGISAKLIKMPANIIDCYLANIINNDVSLNIYSKHAKTATGRPIFKKDDSLLRCKSFEYFFENIQTISAWKSHKLRRHIFFKIYFHLSQVLKFKSCINSLNRKLEKILRSKNICRDVVNGVIKSFWFHTPRSLDSKNACLWFLNRCCYVLLFAFYS